MGEIELDGLVEFVERIRSIKYFIKTCMVCTLFIMSSPKALKKLEIACTQRCPQTGFGPLCFAAISAAGSCSL